MLREEFNSLIHSHVKNIVNILVVEFHFEHIVLETLAVARFARKRKVSHKLHLDCNRSFALTFLASSALGVEREIAWRVAHLLGKRLVGK